MIDYLRDILTVFGYIRDIENKYELSQTVPEDIYKLIYYNYPWEERKDPCDEWEFHKDRGEGSVILNAGLIIIPDDVITDSYYLEYIKGITYVLFYNNAKISPPRLPYTFIEFWKEYLDEEDPQFKYIMDDISYNEGPTYDYLMEHPPNDRILPVLEKVVDQLKYPILDSNKDWKLKMNRELVKEGKPPTTTYEEDINAFFKQQTPEFYDLKEKNIELWTQLKQICIVFEKNTNHKAFNIFELFVNIIDIYDRILYDFNRFGLRNPYQITGGNNTKQRKPMDELIKRHHFASKLSISDWRALNETVTNFKNVENQSFFPKLDEEKGHNKIADNLQDFQCISLSFILFIKAFMSETGNCLERGYHIYKAPKSQKRRYQRMRSKVFVNANIKSLKQIKKEKNEGKDIEINGNDIFFHNDNFPLQFDLCIIPKQPLNEEEVNHYGLDEKYDEFGIESREYITPNDKDSIYKLYGDMVEVFRKVIINKNNIDNNKDNKDKKPIKRRDDRYCIVFNQNKHRFYMYPPHINNGGDDAKITHRKQRKSKRFQYNEEEETKENEEEKVRNKYSLIGHKYNDLTNFYLTSKCIIPSKQKGRYYGIDKINFVLSAHFHKQRQWHRHPKLRIYQYFNGGGLRFFYSNKQIRYYETDKDLIKIWPKYFVKNTSKINEQFIENLDIFDDVMDLYKCDAQYFRWDNAVKRQLNYERYEVLLEERRKKEEIYKKWERRHEETCIILKETERKEVMIECIPCNILTVFGYIRDIENKYELSQTVPEDIYKLIYYYYRCNIPHSISELKERMKAAGVTDRDLEKFEEELEDGDHDIESIKEDISDKEQSMLLDFFIDDLKNEKIYDIVKAIMDGKQFVKCFYSAQN